jgi:hypothetical protein
MYMSLVVVSLVVSYGGRGAQQADRCDTARKTIVARGFAPIFLQPSVALSSQQGHVTTSRRRNGRPARPCLRAGPGNDRD